MYLVAVYLHILGAIVWVGGIFFLAMVAVPAARDLEPSTRAKVTGALGRRFRTVGWSTLGLMVVTGIYLATVRGATFQNALVDWTFWTSPVGQRLGLKLLLVLLMAAVSFFHDWVVGPAAQRTAEAGVEAPELRKRSALLARITALLALGVVLLAVLVARPGVALF